MVKDDFLSDFFFHLLLSKRLMSRLILPWYSEVHSVHTMFRLISAQRASDFQNDVIFSTKLYHGLDTEISIS